MRVEPRVGARALLALTALAALVAGRPAFAYRPFDSTDAAVVEKGRFEIEFGPLQFVSLSGEKSLVLPQIIANYGVSPRWEVVLEGKHVRRVSGDAGGPRSSLEDTGFFVKGVLREGGLQERPGWSLACEVGPLLPTIHAESGIGASAGLIASRRLGSATLHLNGTAALTREARLALTVGAIIEGNDRRPVRPVAEVVAERDAGAGSTVSALAGLIYRAGADVSFDGALRLARVGADTSFEIRAGITFALGRRAEIHEQ